jgi:hypothetical protein
MLRFARYIERHHLALIALFVALGGTSYAAVQLPAGSVGTKQLKKNAVTAKKIRNGTVTSVKIKDNAVTGADVNEASLTEVPNAAHARNADTATNAVSAANATNAGHATTADTATNALTLSGIGIQQLMFTPARGYHLSKSLFQLGGSASSYQVNNPQGTAPIGTLSLGCSDPAQLNVRWVNTSNDGARVWIDSGGAAPTTVFIAPGAATSALFATDPDHLTFYVNLGGDGFLDTRVDVWAGTFAPNFCGENIEVVAVGRSS